MTRQATPDLLAAAPAPAPTYDLAAALAGPAPDLADDGGYDYASLGAVGPAIRLHVLAIKRAEQRMAENTVDAGLHLIAIRETIPHGHWEPLLRDVLGLSERTGQSMMQIARRFGSKAKSISLLSPTVLGVLAPPSVPDAAVDAAIAAAEVSPVTVTAAKAIIAQHRPARCRKCGRTLTDPDAIRAGIGSCCAARLNRGAALGEAKGEAQALPEWVTDGEPATGAAAVSSVTISYDGQSVTLTGKATPAPTVAPPQGDSGANGETHADPHTAALVALAARLEGLREEMRTLGDEYGKITGDFTTPLEIRHKIEKMQVQVKANQGGWE